MSQEPETVVYAVLSREGTRYFTSEHELASALTTGLRGEVRVFVRSLPHAAPPPPQLQEILRAEIEEAFAHRFESTRSQHVHSLAAAIRQVVRATLQPLPAPAPRRRQLRTE